MRTRPLLAGTLAASLLLSGCANSNSDGETAGALLLGAAVVGLGVWALTSGDDDDGGYQRSRDHDRRHQDRRYEDRRYANNGRCDDARYRTSNGGHAEAGTDERDCRRYGDGRK